MDQGFFQWKTFAEAHGNLAFPMDVSEELFLVNLKESKIWLTRKLWLLLFGGIREKAAEVSFEEFGKLLLEGGRHVFEQEMERMRTGKAENVSFHLAVNVPDGCLNTVVYIYRLEEEGYLLGFLSVDYESGQEYEENLQQAVRQLQHVRSVNELILEGATDYIYQLDVVNNVCTFSSKSLEVLDLESPTFSDAMNRILAFIVPEDRQIFLDSYIPFLTGQSEYHTAQYRVKTKQGDIMWISCHGKGMHDEEGRPLMIAGSLMDITEEKKSEEKINKMLYEDLLTGLKNRRCFEKEMETYLKSPDVRGSFLLMNIRRFKLFNEMFGHSFGNQVLKEFSYMLGLYFPNALGIYRFSGDEFLVHLKEWDSKRILAYLMPFQENLKKTREVQGHSVYINTYVAITLYPEHGKSVEELLNHANQCIYRMSREEKDGISFFSGQTGNEISQQYLLENELRKDIQNDFEHFRVVFQPIVDSEETGDCWMGAEALLRYNNPAIPELQQMEMIRTLEYSGLILTVGRWVLSKAIREYAKWGHKNQKVVVHVNIAAQQVSDAGLVQFISDECEKAGISPSALVLELTETSLFSSFDMAKKFCESVLAIGAGVALDDFGTGYSGFRYLRNLPISEIKIDLEYIRNLPENRYNQIVVSFLHELSEEMGYVLCAEGVETEKELKLLKSMGVSVIQGFYFERPMEAEVIRKEFVNHQGNA